jgi:hypothetical protein
MKAFATLAAALLATTLAGCGNLSFRVDKRLHWQAPPARALVKLPVVVSWSMPAFAPGGRFAIFVDRAPIKPGQTLRAVGSNDASCKHDPTCPNADYLAQRQIYTTSSPSITLTEVSPLRTSRDRVQLHQLSVVLLDATGHRIGESAWTREFRLRRVAAP